MQGQGPNVSAAPGIRGRIERDIQYHHGQLPEVNAVAWQGYLAALLEWDVISVSEHEQLISLLPRMKEWTRETDPILAIFLDHPELF